MKDESPFAFAGIWDEWRETEISITSCAIITTTANELLDSVLKTASTVGTTS